MQANRVSEPDWRDAAAYAQLLGADRSFFAWEWLRRDSSYRAAAERALRASDGAHNEDPAAEGFGLVRFEAPDRRVPDARPFWLPEVEALVLKVERGNGSRREDAFALDRLGALAILLEGSATEHLLLSDGFRAIQLNGPDGTFSSGPVCLRYVMEGMVSAEAPLLTMRRLLALCRRGEFSRSLHPPEVRARRWILMLRAHDALAAGADQRAIASELFSRSACEPRWRSREPTVRLQVQRLVHHARLAAAGGYRLLI